MAAANTVKVKVLPKTRVVYIFKRYEKHVGELIVPNIASGSAVNNSEEPLKVELLKEGKMTKLESETEPGSPSMSIDVPCEAKTARIVFESMEQMEHPILIKHATEDGVYNVKTIYPLAYVNPYLYGSYKIIDIGNFNYILSGHSHIEAVLPKKGDSLHVALYDQSLHTHQKPVNNLFPVWIENSTTEEKTIFLVNNMEYYEKPEYAFPEGIKVTVKSGEDWGDQLRGIEATQSISELAFKRIYVPERHSFPADIKKYCFNDDGDHYYTQVITPVGKCINPNQYNSNIIEFSDDNNPYILPFKDGGKRIKAYMEMKMPARSRMAIFCELVEDRC